MTNRQLDILITIILEKLHTPEEIKSRRDEIRNKITSSDEYRELAKCVEKAESIGAEFNDYLSRMSNAVDEINSATSIKQNLASNNAYYRAPNFSSVLDNYITIQLNKEKFSYSHSDIEKEIVLLKTQGVKDNQLINLVVEKLKNNEKKAQTL